jgi:hypothetical protein
LNELFAISILFAFTSVYFKRMFTVPYKISYCTINHTVDYMPQIIVNYFSCVALNINCYGEFR